MAGELFALEGSVSVYLSDFGVIDFDPWPWWIEERFPRLTWRDRPYCRRRGGGSKRVSARGYAHVR
jgi:hypothetical protein